MSMCTDDNHWWRRTPPVPFDPPGHVEQDALCLCGQHRYSEERALLEAKVKITTFVVDEPSVWDRPYVAHGPGKLTCR